MDYTKFPANIYKTYKEYLQCENPIRKLYLLFDVYSQVITFFGCVFLSEYLYSDEVDPKLNDAIIGLAHPSLGIWIGFIEAYAKHLKKKEDPFIPEYLDCFKKIYSRKSFPKCYKGRFRKDSIPAGNALDEILILRNAIAHGGVTPTDEEATEILCVYDQYLDAILQGFDPIFSAYTVAKAVKVEETSFGEYTVYFDLIDYDSKHNEQYALSFSDEDEIKGIPAEEYIQEGTMYLLCEDERLLRFAEYLVDILDDAEHEDYYLFNGYGNRNVDYIGIKYKKQLAVYLDAIKTKLAEKGANTRWKKNRAFEYESFCEYLNDLSKLSVHIHEKSGKYNPSVYVERECDVLLDDFIQSDKTTLIVTAEAGVGKTNFLCHATEKLIRKGMAVYFYNGQTLTETAEENILFRKLQSDCLNEMDFGTALDFLRYLDTKIEDPKKRLILIVDAANEAYDVLSVLNEIELLTAVGEQFPWLKIMVSIRTVSYRLLKDQITDKFGKKMSFLTSRERYYSVTKDSQTRYLLTIEEWNILQVIDAFEKYRVANGIDEHALSSHSLGREMQTILRSPLNMSLFFKAYRARPDADLQTEDDLFRVMEESWDAEDEVTESMRKVLGEIVSKMEESRRNTLDSDVAREIDAKYKDPNLKDIRLLLLSPLERLLDAGILCEKTEENVSVMVFVYQKYLEYLFAAKMQKEKMGVQQVIERLLDAMSWEALPEVSVACLKMLEQEPDLVVVADQLILAGEKREIPIENLKTMLFSLWFKAAVNGQAKEVAVRLVHRELLDWGIRLIGRLNESEESDASYGLTDALIDEQKCDDPRLHFLRALYFMKTSRNPEAIDDLNYCISRGDEEMVVRAKVQLAKTYRKDGKVEAALQVLGECLVEMNEHSPYYDDALIQRGLCKRSNRDYEGAYEDYQAALKVSRAKNDYYVTIYNQLGISTILKDLGNVEAGVEVLLEVYREAGRRGYIDLLADSLNGLSEAFVRLKKYKKAISYAEQGLQIWRHSKYYMGQAVLLCTIMKAMHGLHEPKEKILEVKAEADKLMPMMKERVLLELYERTVRLIEED